MAQYQENATVTRVEQFSAETFRLTLQAPQIAGDAQPGQFVMVRTGQGKDPLLRRPFSLHQTFSDGGVQLYFKVVGRGTEILSRSLVGERLSLFGPLGRGFRYRPEQPAVLIGGGLGIAPMLFLAREISRQNSSPASGCQVLLGARQKGELAVVMEDFAQYGSVHPATDDGSLGHHGLITEVLFSLPLPAAATVYACGPEGMLAAVAGHCRRHGFPCQVSVESVMACGMGACLGCNRPASAGGYTHVCLDGPVYDAEELLWMV